MFEGLDRAGFETLNALAGRSWALDSLIALALDNLLVKAGPMGACFLFAWYRGGESAESTTRRRRILLVTLLSLLLIAPVTKTLSESRLSPRPLVAAEQGYVLRGGALAAGPRVQFRAMETGEAKQRSEALREGRLEANDLATFPSDHAALFVALALGILLACRRAGAIALAWALLVTLGSRVAAGLHWPLDIAAGAVVGAAMLVALQLALGGRRARLLDPIMRLAAHYPGLTAALLFLALVEAANTMQTLKAVQELGSAIAGRLL
jgi:membrane-associated phospholipid phosphatase